MKQALAALLVVTALSAAPVQAQTNPTSTTGVVVSSTTESLVVRMDDGTQRTFKVDTTSMLPSGRLAEGNRITVRYQPIDGGLFRAENVTLVDVSTAATGTNGDPAVAVNDDENLPATASPLPLLALAGGSGLLTALALSKARRNS